MYPVGSCYFSTVATSPATVIGGTWAAMTGGMLGLAGSTGVAGAASSGGSRKILISQMPSHTHGFTTYFYRGASTAFNDQQWMVAHTDKTTSIEASADSEFATAATGGGARLYSCSHFCLWLEKNCLTSWEVSSKWHL